jgi:hypothetical protein
MTTATVLGPRILDRENIARWVYFFTASLFVVTALAGFSPR